VSATDTVERSDGETPEVEKGPAFVVPPGPTVRFRFTKQGKVRFTSHRDVARLWERALRRAGLGIVYSEGFSPRPRVAFGLALPTGHSSDGEYVDMRLDHEPTDSLAQICARLSEVLPDGIAVVAAEVIPPGTPSLQEAVGACSWTAEVGGPTLTQAEVAVMATLARTELPVERERKGKPQVVDLRPAIQELTVAEVGADAAVTLTMVLATRPASFRPEEVVEVIDPSWQVLRACRTNQWIIDEDAWREPVPLAVPSSRAEVRAS
jgi:radical SAM-linked protein